MRAIKRSEKLLEYLRKHPGKELSDCQKALRWTRTTAINTQDDLFRQRLITQRGIALWLREDPRQPYYQEDHAPLTMPDMRQLLLDKVGRREPEGSMHSIWLDEVGAMPAAERTPGMQRELDLRDHRQLVHEALFKFTKQLLDERGPNETQTH
jgi:hypothetical protein